MKKKVKKIPKYNGGTPAIIDPNTLNAAMSGRFNAPLASSLGTTQPIASMAAHRKAINNPGIGGSTGTSGGAGLSAGSIAGGIGNAATSIASAMGIEQTGVSAAFNAAGDIASMIPGVGLPISVGLKTIGAFSGGGGRVDENTGEITKSSGLTRWLGWGHSDASLAAKSSRIKSSNVAREQTQNIQADYYNNPNIEIQPNVLAAEGGIMRTPVDALVSKGELIYNPVTKKLSQVPGSKGKPNKADDVFARLYEGDVVISNSPTMLMSNGKTPAQNLMGMVDKYATGGTVKAREAIIKKVVNWLEANKTKPQLYAMYSDGESSVSPNIKKYGYNKDVTQFAYWDKNKNDYTKEYIDWVNNLTQKDVNDIFAGKYGDMSTYKGVNKLYTPTVDEARKLMTDKKYGDWHKMSQSVMGLLKLKYGALRPVSPKRTIIGATDNAYMHQDKYSAPNGSVYPFDYDVKGMDIPKLKSPGVLVTADRPKKQRTPINWNGIEDGLYKTASILTPLLDRVKAERVDYQVPIAKYRSTAVNVDPLLRSVDDSYAMARYNQANISPNTGAGMAYGLQAATNRAKQLSDVYSWQTNAQNNLIGRNVDTYNKWSTDYANIMNNIYDKAAANRAAARNINRQNRATALKNWGQIRRDDKAYEMDKMKLQMLDPMLQYGYENYDNYLKWKKENGYG